MAKSEIATPINPKVMQGGHVEIDSVAPQSIGSSVVELPVAMGANTKVYASVRYETSDAFNFTSGGLIGPGGKSVTIYAKNISTIAQKAYCEWLAVDFEYLPGGGVLKSLFFNVFSHFGTLERGCFGWQ